MLYKHISQAKYATGTFCIHDEQALLSQTMFKTENPRKYLVIRVSELKASIEISFDFSHTVRFPLGSLELPSKRRSSAPLEPKTDSMRLIPKKTSLSVLPKCNHSSHKIQRIILKCLVKYKYCNTQCYTNKGVKAKLLSVTSLQCLKWNSIISQEKNLEIELSWTKSTQNG